MHELSLMADLLRKIDAVVREQAAMRAVRVTVTIGALAHISEDHFRKHFASAARGTVAEGAELIVHSSTDPSDPHSQDILLREVEVAVPSDETGSQS